MPSLCHAAGLRSDYYSVISALLLPPVLEANEGPGRLGIVEANTKEQHHFGDLRFMNYASRCRCLHTIDLDLCLRSTMESPVRSSERPARRTIENSTKDIR